MRDVFAMSCEPRPARFPATHGGSHRHGHGGPRRHGYVASTLAATVIAALILHLMTELLGRLDSADPAEMLSVLLGMAAVLATLLPFAVLFARRARTAWLASMPPEAGAALLSGPR